LVHVILPPGSLQHPSLAMALGKPVTPPTTPLDDVPPEATPPVATSPAVAAPTGVNKPDKTPLDEDQIPVIAYRWTSTNARSLFNAPRHSKNLD
jgi:hypothetical protein